MYLFLNPCILSSARVILLGRLSFEFLVELLGFPNLSSFQLESSSVFYFLTDLCCPSLALSLSLSSYTLLHVFLVITQAFVFLKLFVLKFIDLFLCNLYKFLEFFDEAYDFFKSSILGFFSVILIDKHFVRTGRKRRNWLDCFFFFLLMLVFFFL